MAFALPVVAPAATGAVVEGIIAGAAAVGAAVGITILANKSKNSTRAKGKDRKIQHIADQEGVSYGELSDAIHDYKRRTGRGGADNLTADEIRDLARDLKG
eukprot:TRINITY_DN1317_c0_g1_i1.p2 TRINITY_DN1317_c0_g1~~TRINITY_DN1317_c0_g1_i1.p2  ORF type:complete len:101 (-),score=54.73 TRINITY_DN1317_c0_g1_i1:86-388(-)